MGLVTRVQVRTATNPEIKLGYGGAIPKDAIYKSGDLVRISPKLAKRWDDAEITISETELAKSENKKLRKGLEIRRARNIAGREKSGIVLRDSPQRPAPPAVRVEATGPPKPKKSPKAVEPKAEDKEN